MEGGLEPPGSQEGSDRWVIMERTIDPTQSHADALDGTAERRSAIFMQESGRTAWIKTPLQSTNITIPLTFAMKHRNVAELESRLLQISNPDSKTYQHFLTQEDIKKLVQPSEAAMEELLSFLRAQNVEEYTLSSHGDYVHVNVPVSQAESMLRTKFSAFHLEDSPSAQFIRAHKPYSLPEAVAEHVDFVAGILRLPRVQKLSTTKQGQLKGRNNGGWGRKGRRREEIQPIVLETRRETVCADCKRHSATVDSLRQLYGVPNVKDHSSKYSSAQRKNKQGVASFFGFAFDRDDVENYFRANGHDPPSADVSVRGDNSTLFDEEPALDLQTMLTVSPNIRTEVWQYEGLNDNSQPKSESNQEPFLRFMLDLNAAEDPPYVMSISYADDESFLSPEYMQRVNTEFIKAGLRGITIVAAAGDDGVGGFISHMNSRCMADKWGYQPQFPASSPYVLSIGGTYYDGKKEVACDTAYTSAVQITTSGGFSKVFARPPYQEKSVAGWYTLASRDQTLSLVLEKGKSHFNSAGRGIPDVAALGSGFNVSVKGYFKSVDGTSASAPLVAGIISLLNDVSLQKNSKPLGFVNPLLYHMKKVDPAVFRDVTLGGNACSRDVCCDMGFTATEGWDPVTGLGTIRVDKMLKYVEHLHPSRLGVYIGRGADSAIEQRPFLLTSLFLFGAVCGVLVFVVHLARHRGTRTKEAEKPKEKKSGTPRERPGQSYEGCDYIAL